MRKSHTFRCSIVRALLVSMLAGWSGIVFAQRHAEELIGKSECGRIVQIYAAEFYCLL